MEEVTTGNVLMYPADVAQLQKAVLELQTVLSAVLGISTPEGITDAGTGNKLKLVVTNGVAEWEEV